MSRFTDLYIDSSVILRSLLGDSPAALAWFNSLEFGKHRLVASRITELEVRRVAQNAGVTVSIVNPYLAPIGFCKVEDSLISEAISLPYPLGAADALHLATALRLGRHVIIVTHDRQMAVAAIALGFQVLDPVTDDPNRPPVASSCHL